MWPRLPKKALRRMRRKRAFGSGSCNWAIGLWGCCFAWWDPVMWERLSCCPDGQEIRRLERLHPRVYQSVFGRFELERMVYGTREGQKIAYVAFDTQLQLPESDFSYLLQDWAQSFTVENTYRRVPE